MGGRTLTIENVSQLEPTRSIINLLNKFQNKEFQGKTGLRAKHFRYAFIGPEDVYAKVKLEEFFNGPSGKEHNKLNQMINSGLIKKGKITSRQQLNHFLAKLENELGAITSRGKRPKRYFIGENLVKSNIKTINKINFEYFPIENTLILSDNTFDNHIKNVFYGIPEKIYRDNEENISNYVKNISDNIKQIENIVHKEKIKSFNKLVKKYKKTTSSKNIQNLLENKPEKIKHILDIKKNVSYVRSYLIDFEKECLERIDEEYHEPFYLVFSQNKIRQCHEIIKLDRKINSYQNAKSILHKLILFFEKSIFLDEEKKYLVTLFGKNYFDSDFNLSFNDVLKLLYFVESNSEYFIYTFQTISFSRFKTN